jgi:hypothetical protein
MIIYFAGTSKNTLPLLKKNKVKNFLISYYYSKTKWLFEKKDNVLLDSGGFTARIQGVNIDVKDYANYINKYDVKLAINLDTNNVEETLLNQKYLNKETNCEILPVYHLSDYKTKEHRNLVEKFANEYPYFCVGGMAGGRNKASDIKIFLDYVYSKVKDKNKIHGLGLTGVKFLDRYPLYSVDSTSWIQSVQYGLTASNMDKKIVKALTHRSKKLKGTKKTEKEIKKQNYILGQDINHYIKLEKYYTKLWHKRGINWVS